VLGLRPFDVQLIGGMILHEGQIAEMRTGLCLDVCSNCGKRVATSSICSPMGSSMASHPLPPLLLLVSLTLPAAAAAAAAAVTCR
jgi:SecA DEAD-like domain